MAAESATPEDIDRQLELSYAAAHCFLPVEKAEATVARHAAAFERLALPTARPTDPSGFGSPKPRRGIIKKNFPMIEDKAAENKIQISGVQLQTRDLALLSELFDCRLMNVEHAAVLHYDSRDVADRRLRKLYEAEVLDRLEYKVSKGRPPAVYTLKKAGFDALIRAKVLSMEYKDQWNSKWRKRFKVSSSTIEHELGVIHIKCALVPAIGNAKGRHVVEFQTWPELLKFKVQTSRRPTPVTVKPDGYLCVQNEPAASRKQFDHFYLEFDTGSEKHDTLWSKYSDYRTYYRNGGFLKSWLGYPDENPADYGLRVLFVMLSQRRLRNFLELYADELQASTQLWLTTLDDIQRDPLGKIWAVPAPFIAAGLSDQAPRFSLLDDKVSHPQS